jgi:Uncharacterized protein conserved in bacteria (DUF2130)
VQTPHRRNGRANGHSHDLALTPAEATCPYCGGAISRQQYRDIRERIEQEERTRIAKVEQTLTAKFAREKSAVETKAKAEADKAKRDAARAAEQQVKALRGSLEKTINERVAAQRAASEKQMAEAVATERARAYAERMKLDAQLADLQRKLQRRTANELGDGAEIDLYAALEAAFGQDDKVHRVGRAVKGPDIIIEVFHHEVSVGTIIIDSKNYARSRWSNRFVEKLKADQIAEGADYAVLSSTAFPKGESQLAVRDGIIIAHPQRVVAVLMLLRRQLIQNHSLRLNSEQRQSAATRVFDYIVSVEAADLFDRLQNTAESLVDIEVREVEAHRLVWTKRGELLRDVQRVHQDLTTAIDMLVSGTAAEGVAA